MSVSKSKAIVLLSGGLDSSTVLAIAQAENYEIYALSFDYGQKNSFETKKAKAIAESAMVAEHKIQLIDMRSFGGSSLTSESKVEKDREHIGANAEIPSTYVPARNTIFLSFALAWADVLEAEHIFIGVNAVDYSGYPDCRPEYIEAFEVMANLATKSCTTGKSRLQIHTPLINLSKSEIIELGLSHGVDYSKTNTCYHPSEKGLACGHCDACILRQKGFFALNLVDPADYEDRISA